MAGQGGSWMKACLAWEEYSPNARAIAPDYLHLASPLLLHSQGRFRCGIGILMLFLECQTNID